MKLFDESALRKLEQLTLVANQVRVGLMKGDRRSRKRGTSIEFADYRNYVRGDDLRRLDWNVYARLERPFIKLLEEEEDLSVHLLVDVSASMDWPDDAVAADENKLRYALLLAGALGHVALASGDKLSVSLLTGHDSGLERWGPARGHQNSLRLFQFLDAARAGGLTDLSHSLSSYAMRGGRPGLLFLVSDMLSPAGYRQGIDALLARGYELGLLHVLSDDELNPPLAGDLKLIDVETGSDAEITLDASTLHAYQQRLKEWQGEIAAYCSRRGIHYVPVRTSEPWDRLVLQTMRSGGLLK